MMMQTDTYNDNPQGPRAQSEPDTLNANHLKMLREESGISDSVIEERGYRTITNAKELIARGFSPRQFRVPGLLLPLHAPDGSQPFCVYRPDAPRVEKSRREGKDRVLKYE